MAGSSWYASTVVLLFLCGLAVQGFAEQAVEDDEVSLDDDMTGFRYTQLLSKDVLLSEPYYEEVECSEQYDPRIAGCSPTRCGRYSGGCCVILFAAPALTCRYFFVFNGQWTTSSLMRKWTRCVASLKRLQLCGILPAAPPSWTSTAVSFGTPRG